MNQQVQDLADALIDNRRNASPEAIRNALMLVYKMGFNDGKLELANKLLEPPAPEPITPASVIVRECRYCDGSGYAENGDRCFYCGGKGRIASEGGEP